MPSLRTSPSSDLPRRGGLADRFSGLLVALVLLLNLAPALAAPAGPLVLGTAGSCSAVDNSPAAESCCCERPAEPVSCCAPTRDCGCMTVPTPSPAEDGMTPDAVLAPATDPGQDLDVALACAADVLAVDVGALLATEHADPPPATAAPPPGGTAGRLGLVRGTSARLAFLATFLR